MAAPVFIAYGTDPSAATGPPSVVATSATINVSKTLIQLKPNAAKIRIIEWGYTFDTVPGAPLRMELVIVNVAATVTAYGANGIQKYNDASGPVSGVLVSTTGSGHNASAEGSITASRLVGYQYENGLYFKQQFPLGREPEVNTSEFLRIRATPTAAGAINVVPYIIWEE